MLPSLPKFRQRCLISILPAASATPELIGQFFLADKLTINSTTANGLPPAYTVINTAISSAELYFWEAGLGRHSIRLELLTGFNTKATHHQLADFLKIVWSMPGIKTGKNPLDNLCRDPHRIWVNQYWPIAGPSPATVIHLYWSLTYKVALYQCPACQPPIL